MYAFDTQTGSMIFRNNQGKTVKEIKEEFEENVRIGVDGYEEIIDGQKFDDFVKKYECFV